MPAAVMRLQPGYDRGQAFGVDTSRPIRYPFDADRHRHVFAIQGCHAETRSHPGWVGTPPYLRQLSTLSPISGIGFRTEDPEA